MKHVLLFLALVMLSGCASRFYYNAKYPSTEQQRYFAGDHGYCLQVAHGSVPMPQIQLNTPSGYNVSGNVTDLYGQNFNYRGSVTPQPNLTSSFADGWNIGNAIADSNTRGDIYEGCLIRLGWIRIPCKTCIPIQAALSQAPQQAIDIAQKLISAGFDERIPTANGDSYFLFNKTSVKREGDSIIVDVAMINLKDIAYSEGGKTYTPLYIIYEYQINKSLGYYKISKMSFYNKSSNILHEKQYQPGAMPTTFFGKKSVVDIILERI